LCFLGANILRDISGNIKLGDFGTSRQLIAITNQNQPDSGTIGMRQQIEREREKGRIKICFRHCSLDSTGNHSGQCFRSKSRYLESWLYDCWKWVTVMTLSIENLFCFACFSVNYWSTLATSSTNRGDISYRNLR